MKAERKSNYVQMKHQMQEKFASYDIPKIIKEWKLEQSGENIRLTLLGRQYFINCISGKVFYRSNDSYFDADYNVTMTVFDILTRKIQEASGEYLSLSSLSKVHSSNPPSKGIFSNKIKEFDHLGKQLPMACESLNGVPFGVGDVSYTIPVFRDLSVIFQFWNSDDEFEPQLNLLWDSNILNFMHFETTMFLSIHLLDRISEQNRKTFVLTIDIPSS